MVLSRQVTLGPHQLNEETGDYQETETDFLLDSLAKEELEELIASCFTIDIENIDAYNTQNQLEFDAYQKACVARKAAAYATEQSLSEESSEKSSNTSNNLGLNNVKIKLRPKLHSLPFQPVQFTHNEENDHTLQNQLKLQDKKTFSNKQKESLIKKLQMILLNFTLHLKMIGKAHLVKDCIVDSGSGSLKFLSFEVVREFLRFKPHIKLRIKCENREDAFALMRMAKKHGLFDKVSELKIGRDLVSDFHLAQLKNNVAPVPMPVMPGIR